ncbi:DUF86 domain-containing protein [soil metagenome]|jgi:uncharacterized protein with HEPN domain
MLPDLVRVRHMRDAILEVSRFVSGRSREDLNMDRMLVLAIIKDIEILGEAASKVSSQFRAAHPEFPWSEAIATRNRLIHGYFDINLDIVWSTATEDLPPLVPLLEQIIRDEEAR